MEPISLAEWAALHNVKVSTARYWARNRHIGAKLVAYTWMVPADAMPPKLRAGNPNFVKRDATQPKVVDKTT